MRRESYNWLVDAVGLYRSRVWEMARLNLTHTMLSKRKLIHLVKEKTVRGWDDPRMPTIQGYRRKGMSPEGINAFCKDIGVTRNASVIPIEKLEEFVRQDLNANSRRIFALYDPVKLTIKNWTKGVLDVEVANVPGKPEKGSHRIPFSASLLVERADVRESDEEDFFGLALKTKDGKPKVIKLKYANVDIKLVDIIKDGSGKIKELTAEAVEGAETRHAIHWIGLLPGQEPTKIEVREYAHLFKSEEPARFEGNWLDDINPNSETVRHGVIDPSSVDLKVLDRVQFERTGYYCVDMDSKPDRLVFNRTMALKESTWKKQQTKK
jgi:glutaminyl-tRNA synthetase